jgi:hypothetical protein
MSELLHRLAQDPLAVAGETAPVIDRLLEEISEKWERSARSALVDLPADRPAQVVGDLHGDYVSLSRALGYARSQDPPHRLVALGDYLDRSTQSQPDPQTLPGGSLWTILHLVAAALELPGEVIPLMGNHEAARRLPVPGPTFFRELRRLFGRSAALSLYQKVMDLAERLPLAARTSNGVFLAHGGIPPKGVGGPAHWRRDDLRLLEALLWSDPEVDYRDRGIGGPFSEEEFEGAMAELGCRVMLRGHAPDHSGVALFSGKLLTLHTSDLFASLGLPALLMAEVPARDPVRSVDQIIVRFVEDGSWRPFPIRRRGRESPDPPLAGR